MQLFNLLIFIVIVPNKNIWIKVNSPSSCPTKVNYYEFDPKKRTEQWWETNRTLLEQDIDANDSY